MSQELIELLDDDRLANEFGWETLARAESYAADGAVRSVKVTSASRAGFKAVAQVSGGRGRTYSVLVHVEACSECGVDIASYCTCPVGQLCKHGAATLLVLGEQVHDRPPTLPTDPWENELRAAIEELEPPEPSGVKKLALQVSLQVPSSRSRWGAPAQPALRVRLIQQGARDNWIKSGIKWSDVPVLGLRRAHDPAQVELLTRMHAGLAAVPYYPGAQADEPLLEAFGPRVWPLLAEASELDIPFVVGDGLAGFAVRHDALEVVADAVDRDGSTTLRIGVGHEGRLWSGPRVLTVGLPAHGVVLLDGDPPHLEATAAALRRPAPVATAKLLRSESPLTVQATDRDRLVGTWLPRLARHVATGSSDGSVTIPEPVPPRLRLSVEWDSATAAEMRWEWVYGDRAVLIDSRERIPGLRDHDAEQEILGRLPVVAPLAIEKVTGPDALDLAVHTLPAIAAVDGVEVVELERPRFREAVGDISIGFDAAPPDETREPRPVDWLDLTVTIRVEGEQVPLPSVLEALTLGHDHVVLPSGLYVATDRPEFAALDDLVQAAGELSERTHDDRVSVGTHDLGLWAQLAEIGAVDAQAAEWVAKARALRDLVEIPAPEPTGIVSTLRTYQVEGFHRLAFLWQHQLGGILADDMGLGKTLQVLALVAHARAQGSAPFLVVAPSSVVSAWVGEAARHAPGLVVRPITASASRRVGAQVRDVVDGADLVVTTYTLLRLEEEQYAEVSWGGLVVDEAQQIKNHKGRTHRAVRMLDAPFKLAVTGTPFENRLMELWALLAISNPGLYPLPQRFGQLVVGPVEKRGDERALRRFQQRIRPFLLRRTKELVASDLPPKQEQVLELELSPKHRRVYDTHLQKERQRILGLLDDFDQNRVAIFSALTRLRLLALDPALVDPDLATIGSAKREALVEHLREVSAEGHRALVFSQFTSYLTTVRERLEAEGLATCYLDGRTRNRAAVIDQWRSGAAPVFLISLKAGGVGLTLTEADYVFVLDPWWNPATEAQAVDRAHRIGQDKPVHVYRLVSADTIEEKVMELKARKAELFTKVIDGEGLAGAAIQAEDIRALFEPS